MHANNDQIAADYFPGTKRDPRNWVRIYRIDNGHRSTVWEGPCEGKRDARKIALQFDATPWNF